MARFTFDEEGNKKVAAQHKGPGKQPPQRAAATGVKPKQQQQHRGPQHQHQRGVKGAAKAPAAADAELWGAPQRAKAAGPQRVQDAGHKRKREAADDEHYRCACVTCLQGRRGTGVRGTPRHLWGCLHCSRAGVR